MIILHQTPRAWGLPNMSPFCAKLETYLRMTKLEYKVAGGSPLKAPKGRVPYVTLDDGKVLGDSNLIIEELKKRYGDPLDEKLTDRQKAMALALQSLIEDKLYFAAAYLRWAETDSWNHVREVLLKFMPPVIGGMILKKIRKGFLKDLGTHGIADFSREEIVKLSTDSLTALSVLLGDQDFFLGSEPSSVDAAMYGFLIQQIWIPWDSPVKQHALGLKNLVSFCERMKARYWEPSSKI